MAIDFFEIAKCVAAASKDPKYKVGAVIFDTNGNIRSTGYNGAPRGVEDLPWRYEKPAKQYYIAHAELNAIVQAARNGVSTDGCSIIIYGKPPCASCVMAIIQAGIKTVLFEPSTNASNYTDSFAAAHRMLEEAGVAVVHILGKSNG